jgi:hypothetical protein
VSGTKDLRNVVMTRPLCRVTVAGAQVRATSARAASHHRAWTPITALRSGFRRVLVGPYRRTS